VRCGTGADTRYISSQRTSVSDAFIKELNTKAMFLFILPSCKITNHPPQLFASSGQNSPFKEFQRWTDLGLSGATAFCLSQGETARLYH